jgi:hypothetical protein
MSNMGGKFFCLAMGVGEKCYHILRTLVWLGVVPPLRTPEGFENLRGFALYEGCCKPVSVGKTDGVEGGTANRPSIPTRNLVICPSHHDPLTLRVNWCYRHRN